MVTTKTYQQARGLTCSITGCESPVRCKGICAIHYDRTRKSDRCHCGAERRIGSLTCRTCYESSFEPPSTAKTCTGCRRVFLIEEFAVRKTTRGKTKLRSRCRTCEAKEARDRRADLKQTAPEIYRARRMASQARDQDLWKRDPDRWLRLVFRRSARMLGLDPELVLAHLEKVGNRCEACDWVGESRPRHRACIDHCHKTGAFRGFLCQSCNKAAGMVGDCPTRIRQVLDYLTR